MMAAGEKPAGEDPARESISENSGWWDACLLRLYESLTRNDRARPVDLILVLAGRMERKHYGLELYRAGLAPGLLLSVGRFEVSKLHNLGLPGLDGLVALRDQTHPDDRNFFVEVDSTGTRIEKARLPRASTYGEALALRRFLMRDALARKGRLKVMVVSTDVHLRRVALVFDRLFTDLPIEFRYCPVPPRFGFPDKNGWWRRSSHRRFVLSEMMKLAGYRAILSMPTWVARRLMRVKESVA